MNGKVAPGVTGPGVLTVSSATAALNASGSYVGEIAGNTPGNASSNYDQLNFTSSTAGPTLGAALSLAIVNGYTPSASDVYYILSRADAGAFGASTFASLPEGSSVSLGGGITGTITYLANWTGTQAGSSVTGGNDVAIYNITGVGTTPEPASLSVLALAGLMGLRRRRNG